MRRNSLLLVSLFCILVLAACGSDTGTTTSTASPTTQPTTVPTTAPTTVPTPQPAHTGKSAQEIVQELMVRGMPIGTSFTYTADTDLNHLLGRPGQYTCKANFIDTRISSTDTGASISVSDGGSVEVFASVSDAQRRFAYLQSLSTTGNALFAEYEYLDGVAILRVSSQLTPSQAQAYETAFKAF